MTTGEGSTHETHVPRRAASQEVDRDRVGALCSSSLELWARTSTSRSSVTCPASDSESPATNAAGRSRAEDRQASAAATQASTATTPKSWNIDGRPRVAAPPRNRRARARAVSTGPKTVRYPPFCLLAPRQSLCSITPTNSQPGNARRKVTSSASREAHAIGIIRDDWAERIMSFPKGENDAGPAPTRVRRRNRRAGERPRLRAREVDDGHASHADGATDLQRRRGEVDRADSERGCQVNSRIDVAMHTREFRAMAARECRPAGRPRPSPESVRSRTLHGATSPRGTRLARAESTGTATTLRPAKPRLPTAASASSFNDVTDPEAGRPSPARLW